MIRSLLLFVLALVTGNHLQAELSADQEIVWHYDFDGAVTVAKEKNLPLLLYFTGSDWCGYCIKLDRNVLHTKEFAKALGNDLVFVKIDFPMYQTVPPELAEQNRALKEKYHVQGFPTLILLDSTLNELGATGFRREGPLEYAEHLRQLLSDAQTLDAVMRSFAAGSYTVEELIELHYKAKSLKREDYAEVLLQEGVSREMHPYFLGEQYTQLVEMGYREEPETREIRDTLLSLDPQNEYGIAYTVALVDFSNMMNDPLLKQEQAAQPLQEYLEQFGASDRENAWRIKMTLAQILMDGKNDTLALAYAKEAQEQAPEDMREDIAEAISLMQKQMESASAP